MQCRPEVRGARGAVSATHWLSAAAGTAMLDRGGNAFDAAAAAAFVSQVVEPHLNGPAGDVPILAHDGATGAVDVICGQGPMPRGATPAAMRERGLDVMPGSGLLSACVPGAFGAWMRLLAERGTLDMAEVLEPAIGHAERGFPLLPTAARMIEVLAPLFRKEWTTSGATYLIDGEAPAPRGRFRNPDLAATFRRLVAHADQASGGRENRIEAAVTAFYQGFVADAIDRFVREARPLDATGTRQGGVLTGQDLADWAPPVERPLTGEFAGLTVHKAGPWSQGPVFLQQLALLDSSGLAAAGHGSAEHVHRVVEGAKLSFADREAFYGDPEHVDVPLDALLGRAYADERRAAITDKAAHELTPGAPAGRVGWSPALRENPLPRTENEWMAQLAHGIPAVVALTQGRGDTCCITAADTDGNLVAASPSGGWLKSSPVVPGLGFALGTRGQMAWLDEGHPNVLASGKRPRTTLSPTLVTRDGQPYLAFGTPGGDQQDQWTLNFLLNHVVFGQDVQAATETTTFHTDAVPTSFVPREARERGVVMEADTPDHVVEELRTRGHDVSLAVAGSLGKVCASGMADDGLVLAAASPRGQQAYAVAH